MTWQQTGYSGDEVMRMQQDAVRRVREMQRRADAALRQGQSGGWQNQVHNGSSTPQHNPSAEQQAQPQNKQSSPFHNLFGNLTGSGSPLGGLVGPGSPLGNLLGGNPLGKLTEGDGPIAKIVNALGLDTERIIIIIMIILLLNDGGDSTLILALCYLLF